MPFKKSTRSKVIMPRSFENKYDNSSTRRSGEKALAFFYNLLGLKPDDDVRYLVKDSDKLSKLLEASKVKDSTKDSYLGYLLMILRCEKITIPKDIQALANKTRTIKKKNLSAKSKGNAANKVAEFNLSTVYDWIKAKMNKARKRSLTQSNRTILMSFILDHPYRIKELTELKYQPWDGNYVDLDKKIIYINKHKGKHEREPIALSDRLIDDLKAHQKAFPYEYVFIVNRKPLGNVPMDSPSLTKLFSNLFKTYQSTELKRDKKDIVYIGARDIRKLHVANNLKGAGVTPEMVEAMMEMQKKLGHNAHNTMFNYYY